MMGKRVRVLTKCGEESFYDFDQEVDTVEIIEEPKNITELRGVHFKEIARAFNAMPGSYVVRIKKRGGNIIINGCGVLSDMWPYLVKHCNKY